MKSKKLFAITSDIDWASDEVIEYMLEILAKYNVRATLFCTHAVSSVKGIDRHELAIHPNFTRDKAEEQVIKELKAIFPEAKGVRNHRLYHHSRLFPIYREFGLEYDSNCLIPNQIVHPFYASHDIIRIPMFFEDDQYISTSPDFRLASINMRSQGLRVFNFHPGHIFLNRCDLANIETTKKYRQEPGKLLNYRNLEKRGIYDFLTELLEYIKKYNLETCSLDVINKYYREQKLPNRNSDIQIGHSERKIVNA
jgi:hypothetical protein